MASIKIAAAAAGLVALTLAASAPAEAQYRRGWNPGAAAAVGILGGIAAGAAIASTARPAYGAAPVYDAPPPPVAYYPPPPRRVYVSEEVESRCYVKSRRYLDEFGDVIVRRVRICD